MRCWMLRIGSTTPLSMAAFAATNFCKKPSIIGNIYYRYTSRVTISRREYQLLLMIIMKEEKGQKKNVVSMEGIGGEAWLDVYLFS
jgi:hypothetical protein